MQIKGVMYMRKDILNLLSPNIRRELAGISSDKLNEIRLRTDKPLILTENNREYFVNNGILRKRYAQELYIVSESDLKETMEFITNYSLYAYNDELKKGFITVSGGHRIGICGKVVYEDEKIKTIRNIQSMNIRVSHQIVGCGEKIVPYLKTPDFENTLIISSPGMGKTTLLRDLIRILSNQGANVGVVDERSEIASCYLGKPQNDVGIRTDVLDCCQKKDGMLMLVRSMRPDIIAVDEIGGEEDAKALQYISLCGCKILATIHGGSLCELEHKSGIKEILQLGLFQRFILCERTETGAFIRTVYNEEKRQVCMCDG